MQRSCTGSQRIGSKIACNPSYYTRFNPTCKLFSQQFSAFWSVGWLYFKKKIKIGRDEFSILLLAEGFRMLFHNEVPVETFFLHVRKQQITVLQLSGTVLPKLQLEFFKKIVLVASLCWDRFFCQDAIVHCPLIRSLLYT